MYFIWWGITNMKLSFNKQPVIYPKQQLDLFIPDLVIGDAVRYISEFNAEGFTYGVVISKPDNDGNYRVRGFSKILKRTLQSRSNEISLVQKLKKLPIHNLAEFSKGDYLINISGEYSEIYLVSGVSIRSNKISLDFSGFTYIAGFNELLHLVGTDKYYRVSSTQ